MKMSFDVATKARKVEVFVSEKRCLERGLSILDGLAELAVPGAKDAAVAVANVIKAVTIPKTPATPSPTTADPAAEPATEPAGAAKA